MKVLIVRVGAMGDVLHALPAVTALRRARPDWEIDWVVDERWAPLLVDDAGRGPVVGRAHLAETKLWSRSPVSVATLRSVGGLRNELREARYDLVVDMQGTLRSAVLGGFAKAARFVGYADPRESLAARLYKTRVPRQGVHVVAQSAALLGEAAGVELTPAFVELPREQWAENWAAEEVVARPMCVLAAGGGWGAKQWPVERFGELAKVLRARGFDVVVNAARKDETVPLKVVEASEGAARTVVCNVSGLVALMRRTDLLVGGDTGPMHLAAMMGVPVVGLYGPTNPARNGPWGPGVCRVLRHESSVTSHKKVEAIDRGLGRVEVAEVVEAVKDLVRGLAWVLFRIAPRDKPCLKAVAWFQGGLCSAWSVEVLSVEKRRDFFQLRAASYELRVSSFQFGCLREWRDGFREDYVAEDRAADTRPAGVCCGGGVSGVCGSELDDAGVEFVAGRTGGLVAGVCGRICEEECGAYRYRPVCVYAQSPVSGVDEHCVWICRGGGRFYYSPLVAGGAACRDVPGDLCADDFVGRDVLAGFFCRVWGVCRTGPEAAAAVDAGAVWGRGGKVLG